MNIDTLSREFFISRTKLTRDFRAALGMSVSDYITAVRINRSKIFLDENRSVAETALLCGFSSSSHYIGVFAKLTGRTAGGVQKTAKMNYLDCLKNSYLYSIIEVAFY